LVFYDLSDFILSLVSGTIRTVDVYSKLLMCTVNSQLYVFQYSNVQNYLVLTEMDKKLKVTPPNAVKNNKR